MYKTFEVKVTSGMDSVLRVMTTLRKRQFDIKEFSMHDQDGKDSLLSITLQEASCGKTLQNALLYLGALADVYDVAEA